MLAIRRAVIEYGALPIATWLHHLADSNAIVTLLEEVKKVAVHIDNRWMVDVPTLAKCLFVPEQHAQVLVDTIDAVTEPHHLLVRRSPGRSEAEGVDAYAVALFLFAQLYIRQGQRPEAMEVWPALSNGEASTSSGQEPLSPARSGSTGSSRSGGHGFLFQQQKSNHLVRRELQAHLQQHGTLMNGYSEYIRRNAPALLQLVLDHPSHTEGSLHGGAIAAAEFDRLSFLLHAGFEHAVPDGSPMDVSPSPFKDDGWRLSLSVPLFTDASERAEASIQAVAEWLDSYIFDDVPASELMASSPSKGDRWSNLPPAGIVQGSSVDIQGVCKSTLVRGEDDFPSGTMRITDCHDTNIYALAPLQYASIICCTDCTVVVGAVGRMLRVENCERLVLIAACVRVCISTCHDSVIHLGINRPPLLIGDNRMLQLAPYNTQYERLAVHLAAAGIEPEHNYWDRPVTLALQHKHATPDSEAAEQPGSAAKSRPPVQLLPPEQLLPFMVPFQGGHGPLCGGAATGGVTRLAADLGAFVGLGEPGPSSSGSPSPGPLTHSPFRLPPAYEEAKERKVAAVSDLRSHIKMAVLDDARKRELQTVIQAYFKDWLQSSGNMRQVYDLARMEREEGGGAPPSPRSL